MGSRLVVFALCASSLLAQGGEKPKPVTGEMGLTGVLNEEEFKALHALRGDKAPPLRGEMLDVDGKKAYLSLPKGAKAPLPAVLVIHEWWGLNQHVKHWADRLAADGYAALAVDLYGGEVATDRSGALKLMRSVDGDSALKTLRGWHGFLAKHPKIKAQKRASIGWCFGGGWSLRLALASPDLDAAVIYYGRLVSDAKRLAAIKAEVLGVFGEKDRGIPPRAVNAFAAGLKEAGVRHTILQYDANHAFANPSSARYDQKSASAAWTHVRKFLARKLKQ